MSTKKFDAKAVLSGTIPEVEKTLGDLSWSDLHTLHTVETTAGEDGTDPGQNRDGVVKAIQAEQDSRTSEFEQAMKLARESGEKAGLKIFTQAEIDELQAEAEKRDEASKARIDELEAEVAALKKANGAKAAPKARKVKPRDLGETSEGADYAGATTIAFVDTAGKSIATLPDLEFGEGQFDTRGSGRRLTETVTIPENSGATELGAVALIDSKGRVAGLSKFLQPLPVGGPREVKLPAGSLLFRQSAKMATAPAR